MSTSAQVSLAPDEVVIIERRQSLLAPAARSALPFVEALGLTALFLGYLSLRGFVRALAGGLILFLALLVLAHASLIWVRWYRRVYLVTDRRAIRRDGILAVVQREAPLEKAQNVTYIQGGLEKVLGLGRILIETSSAGKPITFDLITEAPRLTEAIMQQIDATRGRATQQERAEIAARLRKELGMTWPREAQ